MLRIIRPTCDREGDLSVVRRSDEYVAMLFGFVKDLVYPDSKALGRDGLRIFIARCPTLQRQAFTSDKYNAAAAAADDDDDDGTLREHVREYAVSQNREVAAGVRLYDPSGLVT